MDWLQLHGMFVLTYLCSFQSTRNALIHLFLKANGEKRKDGEKWERFGMEDIYNLAAVAEEQRGFRIITTEQFLLEHAMTGKLIAKNRKRKPAFPPHNRTDWNKEFLKPLKLWLKTVTTQITWRPESCIGVFAAENDPDDFAKLRALQEEISHEINPGYSKWIGNPTPVDSDAKDRMWEMITKRKKFCIYDEQMHQDPYLYYKILYDPRNYTLSHVIDIRLLTFFYCFFFFENWRQDLWSKRFIRDHLRYKDEFQCAAARVVEALRERAREHPGGKDGEFDTFHIRRDPEFEEQYGNLTDAESIYRISKGDLVRGATVYIATDEKNRTFFQPLMDRYDVVFLDDFMHLIKEVNPNFYLFVDQLVATQGRKFFGAWCSTFTGYINRMRGYHSTKRKLPGYKDGTLDSYIYNRQHERRYSKMRLYHPPEIHWFQREFPISWRDIDHDVRGFAD